MNTSESSSSQTKEDENEETAYPAIEILKERKHEYLIKWAGDDPITKKPWEPTWEPKQNANDLLKQEWLEKLAQRRNSRRLSSRRNTITTSRSTTRNITSTPQSSAPPLNQSSPSPLPSQQRPNRKKKLRPSTPSSRKKKTITSSDSNLPPAPSTPKPPPRKTQPDTRTEEDPFSARKRRKINHIPNEAQQVVPPSHHRSPSSLPSPSQLLTRLPPQSQSISHLSSSQKLKLVVVPETQSSDDDNSKQTKPLSVAAAAKTTTPIDSLITNRSRTNSVNSNRNKLLSPRKPENSSVRSKFSKSVSRQNDDDDDQSSVQNITNLQQDEKDDEDDEERKEDEAKKKKEHGHGQEEDDDEGEKEHKKEQQTAPDLFFDESSVSPTSLVDEEYAQLSFATMPITQNANLDERSKSPETISKKRDRSSDGSSSDLDPTENAQNTILVSETDEPSMSLERPRQAYEPDEDAAKLIEDLNDFDDPNHKSLIIQCLKSSPIDAFDKTMLIEFVLDPVNYLANPKNEIDLVRSQYSIGNHVGFEVVRRKSGSICFWLDLIDPNKPSYKVVWNEAQVLQELHSMIFRYQRDPSSPKSSIARKPASSAAAQLSQSQMTNRSLITGNDLGDGLFQEVALEFESKSEAGPPQDAAKEVKNEAVLPPDDNQIPSGPNESPADSPPHDKSSQISDDSKSDSNTSEENTSKRIKELEIAIEALQALLGGALDVNADADERERILIESFESKLKDQKQIILELEAKNSDQVTLLDNQQTSFVKLGDQLKQQQTLIENYASELTKEKECVSKLKAENLSTSVQLTEKATELSNQQASLSKLEDELKQKQSEVDSYETRLTKEKERVSQLEAQNLSTSVELTGQRACMLKLEDELTATKNEVKSLESRLKEAKHPVKQVYDAFIQKHQLESSRLKSDLNLAFSSIAKLRMLAEKDMALMKSLSGQNEQTLRENEELKAIVFKQTIELKKMQVNFDDLKEADEINLDRIKMLEAHLEELKREISLLSPGDETETNGRGKESQLELDNQQAGGSRMMVDPMREVVVPENPKEPSKSDMPFADDQDKAMQATDKRTPGVQPSPPHCTSISMKPPATNGQLSNGKQTKDQPRYLPSIPIQVESPTKKGQLCKERNESQTWNFYQPMSQLERPSLGGDQNELNHIGLSFFNGHDLDEESMNNTLESPIHLTQHGMNNQESNSSSHPQDGQEIVKLGDKMISNLNKTSSYKMTTRSRLSSIESPAQNPNHTINNLFDSSDSNTNLGRHSCSPNGQTKFKTLRSSIQFSSPSMCLPKLGTFVTTTTTTDPSDNPCINSSSSSHTVDTHTVLGDIITQSFSHSSH